jgi:HAD superfamily hydrolase (TIGR01509 family)
MPKKHERVQRLHEIEAVIFDLDGVLVDSEPIHFRAANRVLARYGTAISDADYRTYIGLGEGPTWTDWRRRFRLQPSVHALIEQHTAARLREIAAGVPAIADAVDVARRLYEAAVALAIASSSTPAVIGALLTALGLADVFSLRVSGEDPEVHTGKPAPDIYRCAAARLGVAPAACVAIEDSSPGVLAATGAGMFCIAVPNHWTADQDFSAADIVMESLRYFPLLVR